MSNNVPEGFRAKEFSSRRTWFQHKKNQPDIVSSEIKHQPYTTREFEGFYSLCIDNNPSWVMVYDRRNITVWTRKVPDGCPVKEVRIRAQWSDIKPETMYSVLHDHEYRFLWDANMIDGYPIRIIDKNNEIGYYAAKSPSGMKNRDFCTKRGWSRDLEKGIWIIMNQSVKCKDCPQYKHYIRAQSHRTGYVIKKMDNGGSEVYFFSRADPKGSIPKFMVNWVATKYAPMTIERVKLAVEGYEEWKASAPNGWSSYKFWEDSDEDLTEASDTEGQWYVTEEETIRNE